MMARVSGRRMRRVVPRPSLALHVDGAAQLVDVAAHHVHAHAAAGQVAHRVGGGKAGLEDQVDDLAVGQVGAGGDQAPLHWPWPGSARGPGRRRRRPLR